MSKKVSYILVAYFILSGILMLWLAVILILSGGHHHESTLSEVCPISASEYLKSGTGEQEPDGCRRLVSIVRQFDDASGSAGLYLFAYGVASWFAGLALFIYTIIWKRNKVENV
jgi:hypothetical protein